MWSFPLTFDSRMHSEQPYFDVRVMVCFEGLLCNIYLVGILILDCHNMEIIFYLLTKFLDALYPDWLKNC